MYFPGLTQQTASPFPHSQLWLMKTGAVTFLQNLIFNSILQHLYAEQVTFFFFKISLLNLYFIRKVREQKSHRWRQRHHSNQFISFEFTSVTGIPQCLGTTKPNCPILGKGCAKGLKGTMLEDVQLRLQSIMGSVGSCFP